MPRPAWPPAWKPHSAHRRRPTPSRLQPATPPSRRVSRALRWCHAHDPGAVAPLVAFAAWHVDHERSLVRTGMYRR